MQTLRKPCEDCTAGAPQNDVAPPLHGPGSPQSGQHPWGHVSPAIQPNTGDEQSPKPGILPADA